MKTKEELNALKEEVDALNRKLLELTEEELAQVAGGSKASDWNTRDPNVPEQEIHIQKLGHYKLPHIIAPQESLF